MAQESDRLRTLVRSIAEESETLRMLTRSPQGLQQKFDLSDEEIQILRSSKIIVAMRPREITFETGTTIVAGRQREITFETGTTIEV